MFPNSETLKPIDHNFDDITQLRPARSIAKTRITLGENTRETKLVQLNTIMHLSILYLMVKVVMVNTVGTCKTLCQIINARECKDRRKPDSHEG